MVKGIIFPISEENYTRIKKGKNVFVKYCTFKQLKPNQSIQFYVTKRKKIEIKAVIKSIEILQLEEIIKKYHNQLIQSEEELSKYMKRNMKGEVRKKMPRDHSNPLVFRFEDIEECEISPKSRIWTMGVYIR
jgi:hypothetical protein